MILEFPLNNNVIKIIADIIIRLAREPRDGHALGGSFHLRCTQRLGH